MAICPKCKKQIDCLSYTAVTHTTGVLQMQNGELEYNDDSVFFEEADFIFDCPECDKELFTHSSEAEDFLEEETVK